MLPKRPRDPKSEPEIELRPDGWERFERAVGAAAKSGPKHRSAPKRRTRKPIKTVCLERILMAALEIVGCARPPERYRARRSQLAPRAGAVSLTLAAGN
jgi:hypothetical protein